MPYELKVRIANGNNKRNKKSLFACASLKIEIHLNNLQISTCTYKCCVDMQLIAYERFVHFHVLLQPPVIFLQMKWIVAALSVLELISLVMVITAVIIGSR